jgi:hypothetical protein
MLTAVHPKACRQCAKEFTPTQPMQAVCGWRCAHREVSVATKVKKAAEKARDKLRKEAMVSIADRIKLAQREFNSFIRLRDKLAQQRCISSGRALDWSGNAVDAGHYRSTGAASHLRFNEDNCHAQSKQENRYLAGNAADYRIMLIKRIGLIRVVRLETNNAVHKWTHEELIEIRARYVAKRKELEARL